MHYQPRMLVHGDHLAVPNLALDRVKNLGAEEPPVRSPRGRHPDRVLTDWHRQADWHSLQSITAGMLVDKIGHTALRSGTSEDFGWHDT